MDMIKIKGDEGVWIGRSDEARVSIAHGLVAISGKGNPVVCRDVATMSVNNHVVSAASARAFVEGYFAALGIEVSWLDT